MNTAAVEKNPATPQAKGRLIALASVLVTAALKFKLALLFLVKALLSGKLLLLLGSGGLFSWQIAASSGWGWVFAVAITIVIFIHELGHAIAGWRYGLGVRAIVFIPFFGGLAAFKKAPTVPSEIFVVSLAGPAAGILGSIGCFYLSWLVPPLAGVGLCVAAYVGIAINALNLLPMKPLDGARATSFFRALDWWAIAASLWALTIYLSNAERIELLGIPLGLSASYAAFKGAFSKQINRPLTSLAFRASSGALYFSILAFAMITLEWFARSAAL